MGKAEEGRRTEKLVAYLASAGFTSVNEKKDTKAMGMVKSGFTYPLHAAVKANDREAIELLLWGGADRSLTNSKGLTALALAAKLSKDDSHAAVITLLGSGA